MGLESAASPVGRRERGHAAWILYRDNLPRHLMGISRDLQSRVMHGLGETSGHRDLRRSFGPLLSLIRGKGRSLTAIAGDLGVSKQACSQLANLVQAAGYLQRRDSPLDRRSKVLELTRKGRALVEQGDRLIEEAERAYAVQVGVGRYRRFAAALVALHQGLGLPVQALKHEGKRRSPSGGLLPLIVERMQRELMEGAMTRGHTGLKLSHGQVLPLIGADGGRIREIARIQGVSRQAISAVGRDLEALGYLCREPDLRDGRGVVLRTTARGAALIRDSVEAVEELEVSCQAILGVRRAEFLRAVARDLYRALHLEEEIFGVEPAGPPVSAAASPPGRGGRDREIEALAMSLRRRLGSGDAARLAALLEPGAGRRST